MITFTMIQLVTWKTWFSPVLQNQVETRLSSYHISGYTFHALANDALTIQIEWFNEISAHYYEYKYLKKET